ncbi:MAG: type A chloramphenicol O-acetyltransferase [Morganella sp. (in: enterobacteria)]
MNYTKVDLNTWDRKEHFEFYRQRVRCGFSLTTKLDITTLRTSLTENRYQFYPVMIYLITRVVNQLPEFRLAIKEDELICWERVDPAFTIFHKKTETFSVLWSRYSENIACFMTDYAAVMAEYQDNTRMFPQGNMPENHLNISSLPWVEFDGFNLNIADFTDYFSPTFTMAKFYQEGGRILLPLSVQVHHAACDGFHVAKFINKLQLACGNLMNLNN